MKFHRHRWAATALFVGALGAGISPLAYAAGSFTGLGDLPGGSFGSYARATDGVYVVGGSYSALGEEAFYWTQAGGMIGMGDLPGGFFSSFATGISPMGLGLAVVGQGYSASGPEAFRWEAGPGYGMVGLGDLPGGVFRSIAYGVSANGAVVVGDSSTGVSADIQTAFIWDAANGMRSLAAVLAAQGANLTGWSNLSLAYDVSDDGLSIVGMGVHNGQAEAFLAQLDPAPVPAPPAVWLFGSGLVGLFGFARRKARSA